MNQMVDSFFKYKEELIEFAQNHHALWICENGVNGKNILDWMSQLKLSVAGYINSDGVFSKTNSLIHETYVLRYRGRDGIIAESEEAVEKIRAVLSDTVDYFIFNDEIFSLFHRYISHYIKIGGFIETLAWKGDRELQLKGISEWKRILIIRLDAIGDLIMMTPFIRELRRNCPSAHITLVISRINEPLFRNFPYISELILYDLPNSYGAENLNNISEICKKAKLFSSNYIRGKYDVVFHPCEILHGRKCIESLMLALMCNANSRVVRLHTFSKHQDLYYLMFLMMQDKFSLVSYDTEEKHEVLYLLDILRRAGGIVKNTKMEIWIDEVSQKASEAYLYNLNRKEKYIVAVGVVGSIPCKNWPQESYYKMIQRCYVIFKNKLHFIILGGGKDAEDAASYMIDRADKDKINCITNLVGVTSLTEAAAVIEKCNVYIGSNTGLMHMAGAMGIPIVEISPALLGSTIREGAHPIRMGPWGVDYISLRPKGFDECSVVCKKTYPHCTTQISVDDVVNGMMNFLLPQ